LRDDVSLKPSRLRRGCGAGLRSDQPFASRVAANGGENGIPPVGSAHGLGRIK
jgi:hypothetical protein